MRRKILAFLIVPILALSAIPVFAAPLGDVEVQVTPTLVSISVSPTSLNLGTVSLNQESGSSDEVNVINDGSVAEDIDIKGSDADCSSCGPSDLWTLSDGANGPNQYMMRFAKGGDWPNAVYLHRTTYKDFLPGPLSSGANQKFQIRVKMPTATTVFSGHTATISLLATEHL